MAWSWIRPGIALFKTARDPAYKPLLDGMRARVRYWKKHFDDALGPRTGWAHDYVCPQCAGPLTYNREMPQVHHCPACDRAAENTPAILAAWTYFARHEIATAALDAAILSRMEGGISHYSFVVKVIDYYAEHYVEYEEQGSHAGRGKVMGQSLDEAVWGSLLLKALIVLEFEGTCDLGKRWHKHLFLPAARLVMAQSSMVHNIPLWHAAFAVGVSLLFGDEQLYRQSMEGQLGARNQVLRGFTEDGLWFENATGYHFYALSAATTLCTFLRQSGRDEPALFARVIDAYTAILRLRYADGSLPAINDTESAAMRTGIAGRLDAYLYAAHLFAGMPGAGMIAGALDGFDTVGTRGEFLYGRPDDGVDGCADVAAAAGDPASADAGDAPDAAHAPGAAHAPDAPESPGAATPSDTPQGTPSGAPQGAPSDTPAEPHTPACATPPSVLMPHNCLALLRGGPLEVFAKFGNLHGSHAHPDALEIAIPPFCYDLGTSGYGSPFHGGWYAQTLSHATFVVGGASQRSDVRGTGTLSDDGRVLEMAIDGAYEGVAARRRVALDPSGAVLDRMQVRCDGPRQIDWVFHSAGAYARQSGGEAESVRLPEMGGGYGYLRDVQRVPAPFVAHFTVDGRTLALSFDRLPEGAQVYVAHSPDCPANRMRHTVIVRTQGDEVAIEARYALV